MQDGHPRVQEGLYKLYVVIKILNTGHLKNNISVCDNKIK